MDTDRAPRRVLAGFRIVHVFNLSQTDGEPLPDVAPTLLEGAAPTRLWDVLASLADDAGYRLERGDCAGANGSMSFATRTVKVRADSEPAQAVKTLANELGHIRDDHEHRLVDYHQDALCRGRAEIEAESIAYLVATGAGMDTTGYTVPDVAGWGGGNVQMLGESATRVLTVARRIAADLVAASSAGERGLRCLCRWPWSRLQAFIHTLRRGQLIYRTRNTTFGYDQRGASIRAWTRSGLSPTARASAT